jgi:hypothetical protein
MANPNDSKNKVTSKKRVGTVGPNMIATPATVKKPTKK